MVLILIMVQKSAHEWGSVENVSNPFKNSHRNAYYLFLFEMCMAVYYLLLCMYIFPLETRGRSKVTTKRNGK